MVSSQDVLPPPVIHPSLKHLDIQHPNGSDGWLPAEAFNAPSSPIKQDTDTAAGTTTLRRSTIGASPRKSAFHSRTSSRSVHPTERRQPSALVNGGETTAVDEDLQNRAVSANNNLTPKQRSKIAKSEAKDGRRISKIIKQEGRTNKQAVDIAINELEEIQRFQKNSVKSEARAHANHSKSLLDFKRTEAAFLTAKMRYEAAQAELSAEADTLETLKHNSKEAAEKVQAKSAEVANLRATLAVDEREREIRLTDLKGQTVNGTGTKRSSLLWR